MLVSGIRRASIRFEFSPMQEVLRALRVLSAPRPHAEQMDWVRTARRHSTPAMKRSIKRFTGLLHPAPELFPELFPSAHAASFADELRVLADSDAAFEETLVRRAYGKPLLDRAELSTPALRSALLTRALHDAGARDVRALLDDFCALLEAFFTRCLAARWDDFAERARADAAARERLLTRVGVTAALRTLTRQLTARGTTRKASLQFGGEASAHVELTLGAEDTLALTPSYFIWPYATFVVLRTKRLDVRIAYPLASPSTIRPRAGAFDRLANRYAALGDPIRLQLLDLLGSRDLSTRELAGLTSLSEGGVSRHLSILREAELVSSVRDGYFVLYRPTPLARALLIDAHATWPREAASGRAR